MDYMDARLLVQKAISDTKEVCEFPHAFLVGKFSAMLEFIMSDMCPVEDIKPYLIRAFKQVKICPECSREIKESVCVCKESEVV